RERAFHARPSEVLAAAPEGKVDLLPGVPADISDEDGARAPLGRVGGARGGGCGGGGRRRSPGGCEALSPPGFSSTGREGSPCPPRAGTCPGRRRPDRALPCVARGSERDG